MTRLSASPKATTNAAILSIGTELTRGELTNTNASWLAAQLTDTGFRVVEHVAVPDDVDAVALSLRRLSEQARVAVATGGLGPTTDDLTADAAAHALGVPLEVHRNVLEKIRAKWTRLGRQMPRSNERQAMLPKGADILSNEHGTAPGFAVDIGRMRAFFLPGVPREMKPMFVDHVLPFVAPMTERTSDQVSLRVVGVPESEVQDLLSAVESKFAGVVLGYRARAPEIEVKVRAEADRFRDAQQIAKDASEHVRDLLSPWVYGSGDDTFASAVGRVLRRKELTLAIAESCTGGLAAALLTSVAGASDFLLFDAVTYSNHSKRQVLNVSEEVLRAHGAVSEEVASSMAEGARRIVDADIAVSTTGIAGPDGGTDEKPVGTVCVGLARRNQPTEARRFRFPDRGRELIQRLAAYSALDWVRQVVSREPSHPPRG